MSIVQRKQNKNQLDYPDQKDGISRSTQIVNVDASHWDWRQFWYIYLTVFGYSLGINMFMQSLPFLLKDIGASEVEYSYVMSAGSLASMLGSFGAGVFIDRFGSKITCIISYVACIVGYLSSFSASSPYMLYLSRVSVLFQQAVIASRTFVAIETESDINSLSYISVAYGIGAALGPILSGYIIRFNSVQTVGMACIGVNVLCLLIVTVTMNSGDGGDFKNRKPAASRRVLRRVSTSSLFKTIGLHDIIVLCSIVRLRSLLATKALITFASSALHTQLSYTLINQYNFESQSVGFVYTLLGCVMVIVQLAVGPLLTRLGIKQSTAMKLSTMFICSASLLYFLATSYMLYVLSVMLFTAGVTAFVSLGNSLLTRAVNDNQRQKSNVADAKELQGTIIGLDMGCVNLVRVVAPLMIARVNYAAVIPLLCSALASISLLNESIRSEQRQQIQNNNNSYVRFD
ncbi:hypothetical protein MIR68_002003 [Amoeboaphelidium protococcarum]|nr:hypothetical protein MIR68_002003 [Amoeboaphelidium protococcarum]